MKTFKKHAVAMAVAAGITSLVTFGAIASTGDPVIHFDTSAIPGAESAGDSPYAFDYDDFLISDTGETVITQTDTDTDGAFSVGDEFSEFTIVSASGFEKDNVLLTSGIPDSTGLNSDYSLITDITMGGFVSLIAPAGPVTVVVIDFTSGTGSMVYDENIGSGGGSLVMGIADMSLVGGSCTIFTSSFGISGSCVMFFDFDSLVDDLFVSADAGDLKPLGDDLLRVDVNIDEVTGLLALVTSGYGDDCVDADTACTAEIGLTHNGSARHVVSAPGTIALFGLGLLAMARLSRRFGARA